MKTRDETIYRSEIARREKEIKLLKKGLKKIRQHLLTRMPNPLYAAALVDDVLEGRNPDTGLKDSST